MVENKSRAAKTVDTTDVELSPVPAVDNELSNHVSKASDQIDFNDPTLSQEEAVARNLGA